MSHAGYRDSRTVQVFQGKGGTAECIRYIGGRARHWADGPFGRRVAILRGLLADYDLLVLDEPFRGLDQETRQLVMEDTRRRCAGQTVLPVTHDPAELEALGANELLAELP